MRFFAVLMRTVVVAGVVAAATGCSTLNIGEPEYGCNGMPQGVQCMSARDVYAATNDGGKPTQAGAKDQTQNTGTRHAETLGGEVAKNYVSPRIPDQPVPIRTPAEVMRIWMGPWEDKNGDLIVSGYIYTEIEPRRWVIGEEVPNNAPVVRPLSKQTKD